MKMFLDLLKLFISWCGAASPLLIFPLFVSVCCYAATLFNLHTNDVWLSAPHPVTSGAHCTMSWVIKYYNMLAYWVNLHTWVTW